MIFGSWRMYIRSSDSTMRVNTKIMFFKFGFYMKLHFLYVSTYLLKTYCKAQEKMYSTKLSLQFACHPFLLLLFMDFKDLKH